MIQIDFTNMMEPAVKGGISEVEWNEAFPLFKDAFIRFGALYKSGEVGFPDLPNETELVEQVRLFVNEAEGKFDDVVLLGIGGSALGPIALRTALRGDLWNFRSSESRNGFPRFHVLDNVDPATMHGLFELISFHRTLFIVISKSGGTAETMSQFMIVYDKVVQLKLHPPAHFVFVTDPEHGALRALSHQLNIPALDIPQNIGGRFSVLSAVGTLPAALIGIDIEALLKGAGDMVARCNSPILAENPAGIFAALQYLSDIRHGRSIHVLMPYSDSLKDLSAWFVQLWAESLGKIDKNGHSVGPTPLAGRGATDQHSQVQLFMEGPADKTVAFIALKNHSQDIEMPHEFDNIRELAYLGGHSLAELINIEQRATAGALARRGRPNLTIEIDRVDPWHLGGLLMLFELATAFAGQMYHVDAFNQPGVELGKEFAYAMLGRPGSESARQEWNSLPEPDPRWNTQISES